MTKITKTKIISVYKKYPPNNLTKFMFKYFSKYPKTNKLKNLFVLIEIILFIGGALTLNEYRTLSLIFTLAFGAMLVALAIPFITVFYMNNARIKKIAKELGVTVSEYQKLIEEYNIIEMDLE